MKQKLITSLAYELHMPVRYSDLVDNAISECLEDIFIDMAKIENINLIGWRKLSAEINCSFIAPIDVPLDKFINNYKVKSDKMIRQEFSSSRLWRGSLWDETFYLSTKSAYRQALT
jgi:REP element-mobilizing transposase RayT